MREYDDFVHLIRGLGGAPPERGIHLVDQRFRKTFHSYLSLHRRVLAIARQFRDEGVGRGDHVLIALPTEIDAICSFLALIYLGAVPYSISSPLLGQDRDAHRRHIVNLIRLHKIDRLVASRNLAGVAGSAPEAPAEMETALRSPSEEELAAEDPLEPGSVSPGDDAFVQFSSGSTSHPKGVRITHRGLVTNANLIADNDRREAHHVWVSWLPLYHDMGLVGGLLSNFLIHNELVLMHPMCFMVRPVSWLEAISEHRGTTTAIPNFALDHCTERVTDAQLEERSLDLSSFRYIYNGAEPVRPASIRRFEERFGPHGFGEGRIYPVYGMSETTLIFSAPAYEEPIVTREIAGVEIPSVGFPLGDLEASIREEEGDELGAEKVGEIWVKGSTVTPGYLIPQGEEDGAVQDGWLATGDLGMLDAQGRLYITGRIKDLILFQGRNFYGHDISTHIEELPYVRRGKTFVFQTEVEGSEEIVILTAPPESGSEMAGDEEAFRAALQREVLREFGLPVFDVRIVPRIPKTTSGKVARHLCEEIYRAAREEG